MIDQFERDYKRAENKFKDLKSLNERRKNASSSGQYTTKVLFFFILV